MSYGMKTYDQNDLNKSSNDAQWFQDAIKELNYYDQAAILRALQRVNSQDELTLRRVIRQCVTGGSNFDRKYMMKGGGYVVTPTRVWDTTMSGLSKYDQKTLAWAWENLLPSERTAFLNLFANCHERYMKWQQMNPSGR